MDIKEMLDILGEEAQKLLTDPNYGSKINEPKGYISVDSMGIIFRFDWYSYDMSGKKKLMDVRHAISWMEYDTYKGNLKAVVIRSISDMQYKIRKFYSKPT
jgi:hypothetical protein